MRAGAVMGMSMNILKFVSPPEIFLSIVMIIFIIINSNNHCLGLCFQQNSGKS